MEIEAHPERIRGLGNVVIPKEIQEYVTHEATIHETGEKKDGWEIYDLLFSNNPVLIKVDSLEFRLEEKSIMNISFYKIKNKIENVYPNAKANVYINDKNLENPLTITANEHGLATFDLKEYPQGEYLELTIHHPATEQGDSKYYYGWVRILIKGKYTQEGNVLHFTINEEGETSISQVKVTLYSEEDINTYYSDDEGYVTMSEYKEGNYYTIEKEGHYFIKE